MRQGRDEVRCDIGELLRCSSALGAKPFYDKARYHAANGGTHVAFWNRKRFDDAEFFPNGMRSAFEFAA